jgi:hypothetical protein
VVVAGCCVVSGPPEQGADAVSAWNVCIACCITFGPSNRNVFSFNNVEEDESMVLNDKKMNTLSQEASQFRKLKANPSRSRRILGFFYCIH